MSTPRREPATRSGLAWENWSGSLRFRAYRLAIPEDEAALVDLVRGAGERGRTLRAVGAGHSSSPLVETDDTLVSLERFNALLEVDAARGEATVGAGATLKDVFAALRREGLSPHDLGDISTQSLGGSLATGTHGSGRRLGNLSTMLIGGRFVTGDGQVLDLHEDGDGELMRALRVSLGAAGVFTQLRLRLRPLSRLRRTEWCAGVGDTLAHLDELFDRNRKFDFYWYPRSDEVKLRLLSPPGEGMEAIPWAQLRELDEGWTDEIIPKHSGIENRFEEMEYALPAEAGPACFREVRQRILTHHRRHVGWRVLYREVAADDAFLSTAHARASVEISIHHNAGLPFHAFFADIEPIFRAHGGRPHWAKKHNLAATDLKLLYPAWDRFLAVRRRLDPGGVFVSPYLRQLLGLEARR